MESHARMVGKLGSVFEMSILTRRRRRRRWMARIPPRRAMEAATPREAIPMPPAKIGLLKRASVLNRDARVGEGVWSGIAAY